MEQIETEYFVMTTEEKEMLEKILKSLGIELADFLEIRSVKKYKRQTNKRIKALEEENEKLKAQQKEFLKNLIQLNNRLSTLETNKTNNQAMSNLYSILEGDEENGSDND